MPYKSQRMGLATDSEGARTRAYRAVTDLVCSQCGRPIGPGQLFSRAVQQGQRTGNFGVGLAKVPLCVTCRPLCVEGDADAPAALEDKQDEG